MDKQLSTSIVLAVLLFGCAISLSAQNYGTPYQPFRPYQGGAEVEFATMPTAKMSGNIGGSSAYMSATAMPQGEIYEPFTASAPSGATPRRSYGPGGGNNNEETDTKNPALETPIGDGIGFLLMMGLLYMMLKCVLKHVKNSTFLTKCHQMIE